MEDSLIIERGEMVCAGGKRGRDAEEEEEKGKTGRLEKRPSGVVVSHQEYDGEEMINGVKYEEEKKLCDDHGGFFNNLMGNLVNSPKVNGQIKTGVVYDELTEKNGGSGGGDGGGGIIGNMISNIFQHNEGGGGGEEKKEIENGGGDGGDGDSGGGGGGGIIDNIVSQLPRTLSEDAVPATDEASILIHSIIHD